MLLQKSILCVMIMMGKVGVKYPAHMALESGRLWEFFYVNYFSPKTYRSLAVGKTEEK